MVWKANLLDPEVYVVPFGPEFFFTAEGHIIAPGTWWDFEHPPTVSN